MALQYIKHTPISLRKRPGVSEVWLHHRIAEDTAVLGLGELDVIYREKVQYAGGDADALPFGDSQQRAGLNRLAS